MATLEGSTIASTYTYLLKMSGTGGVTGSLVKVQDGDATDSALSISSTTIAIDATDKMYFDGGTHTYIQESGDDVLDIYVGAVNMLKMTEATTDLFTINPAGADCDTLIKTGGNSAMFHVDGGNNRIGIGTASPQDFLHVYGSGAQSVTIGSSNAGGASLNFDGDSNGDGAGGDYSYIHHDTAGIFNIVQDSPSGTNEIRFGTAGAEDKVVINASGNVGIGTTAPNIQAASSGNLVLTIIGNAQNKIGILELACTDVTSTGFIGRIDFINKDAGSSAVSNSSVGAVRDGVDEASRLVFYTEADGAATTEKMTILGSGNVGIGTSAPTSILAISDTSTPILSVKSTEVPDGSKTGGRLDLELNTGNTSNDVQTADIIGAISYIGQASDATFSAGGIDCVMTTGNNTRSNCVADMRFYTIHSGSTGATEKMRITGAGNVGIGTDAPASPAGVTKFLEIEDAAGAGLVLTDTGASWDIYNIAGVLYHYSSGAGAHRLTIATDGVVTVAAGTVTSDERLKKNIKNIDNGLETLKQLQGRTFYWKSDINPAGVQYGLIAQELQEVLPDLVHETGLTDIEDENSLSINMTGIIPVLIEAVKELSAKVEALENA